MKSRTRNNLKAAMECDALDAAKYHRFAGRARFDSEWELATLFEEAAEVDRTEHFAREAELHGSIGDTPENLRTATAEQRTEAERFTRFAKEATEDGEDSVAVLFEKMSREKAICAAKLDAVLANLGVHRNTETRVGGPDIQARTQTKRIPSRKRARPSAPRA